MKNRHDPLRYDFPLPLSAVFYPLGFPLSIETNSSEILNLANALWSRWPARDCAVAARFRIAVEDAAARFPVVTAAPRGQGHLVSVVHSADNFAVCDLNASFAFACFTREVAADSEYVRYHFLEPLAYLMTEAAHLTPVHASAVAWGGNAVVLCGESGAGKTSLAYACARRGWTYLSDDATHILRERCESDGGETRIGGRPFRIRFRESARSLFPELGTYTPRRRPNGKLDIEVDTHELNMRVAAESRASHIVFLDRTDSASATRLDPYSLPEAERLLEDTICYGDDRIREEHRRTLRRFLTLPTLKLTYSGLESAEETLRELASV